MNITRKIQKYVATIGVVGAVAGFIYSLKLIDERQNIYTENENVSKYYSLRNELHELEQQNDFLQREARSDIVKVVSNIETILADEKTVSDIKECKTLNYQSLGAGIGIAICAATSMVTLSKMKHSKKR